MREDDYKLVEPVFKRTAEAIDGKSFFSPHFKMVKVIKDDIVLEYHFRDKVNVSKYVVVTPFQCDNIEFNIRKKQLLFCDFDYLHSILDFAVYINKNDLTKKLVESLYNDLEYRSILNETLGDWDLFLKDNILLMRIIRNPNPVFEDKVNDKDLINAYKLILETKKVLEYYMNKL